MKYVYQVVKKLTRGYGSERIALFVNMALWFGLGTLMASVFATAVGCEPEKVKDCMITTGSCLALAGGYIGGMLWIVNKED